MVKVEESTDSFSRHS